MNGDAIYIISDAHLGAPFTDAPEWERHCISFFRGIADRASVLYLLGDLFDFWIEYRHAIRPDYFRIVHELKNLVDRGIQVHYFAGNHDFALGPFLTDTVGIKVYPGHEETVLQGKRVHLYHGDGLIRRDVGYRVLKRLLRNPLNQALFKLLPPWIGVPLGSVCSGMSRSIKGDCSPELRAEYRAAAKSYLDKGNDIVFFAHSHHAEISRWGNKIYCNTGAWMRSYNFATLDGGVVRLWRYRSGLEPEEVAVIDR
jgi:UDP-2,3-diacylglucosamine hydrolase